MKIWIVTYEVVGPTGRLQRISKGYTTAGKDEAQKAHIDHMVLNEPQTAFRVMRIEEFQSQGTPVTPSKKA